MINKLKQLFLRFKKPNRMEQIISSYEGEGWYAKRISINKGDDMINKLKQLFLRSKKPNRME